MLNYVFNFQSHMPSKKVMTFNVNDVQHFWENRV